MPRKTREVVDWPVLQRYSGSRLDRIAMPLGGIGTGTVSLGGRGQLCDWELCNRPSKGFTPDNTFFALYAKASGRPAVARALEGAIPPRDYDGACGCPTPNHGLPRFRSCSFEAAYPFARVLLDDPDVPVAVQLEAFNPLVPADADDSGIPMAVLRFVLRNRTSRPLTAAVCGNLENFIGTDGVDGKPSNNRNSVRRGPGRWQGLFMQSEGMAPTDPRWGTLALATDAARVSFRTAWPALSWGNALLDYWDDFSDDGVLDPREALQSSAPIGSVAARMRLAPHAEQRVTFVLAWRFPNRMSWPSGSAGSAKPRRVGNYYATRYTDAWDVIQRTVRDLPRLEARSRTFVNALCGSDLPATVKTAALFNLSTLRSQTCFRIESGELMGWEGCLDQHGCCHGSCTHVWNYETATAFLFGGLACGMRTVEFQHATDARGLMSFRVNLPLNRARSWGMAAADGQLGCLVKLYREWQLSGDDALLRKLWPKARKALAFCWIAGGWDGDADGVMEGCQHNTMDVEYYGPNPQMQFWYLAALRAAEEMARYLGEAAFAARCRALFEAGSAWMDANLFNGDYYEHQIRSPDPATGVAPGLRVGMGADDLTHPTLQLGAGCLVDQLVGQTQAHVCGLGDLAKPANIRQTLRSLMMYNWRDTLYAHFNHKRTFALNDEAALLMAAYPRGRRPAQPFPYANEVMTGFEYTAAVQMLRDGLRRDGLKVIAAIRRRYDGQRRNPFNEAECGHHYARAMASWSAIPVMTGFQYSGVERTITFAARAGRHFWSNGYAWGTCVIGGNRRDGWTVRLQVLDGRLMLAALCLTGVGTVKVAAGRTRRLSGGGVVDVGLKSGVGPRS